MNEHAPHLAWLVLAWPAACGLWMPCPVACVAVCASIASGLAFGLFHLIGIAGVLHWLGSHRGTRFEQ